VRYVRLGYYQAAGCPASSCGATKLNVGEVQMFAHSGSQDYISATGTTATTDSSVAGQGPSLAADGDPQTWFGSNAATPAAALLELDVGAAGPFWDDLANIMLLTGVWPCSVYQAGCAGGPN
jgi:hypothetical protein